MVAYYLVDLHAIVSVWLRAKDYVSFVAVVGSLFVVLGGIHIRVKGEATPGVNTAFLAIGALLANVLGKTGAAMLLIRPWIPMNQYRITGYHVDFINICNVGGFLTPIGSAVAHGLFDWFAILVDSRARLAALAGQHRHSFGRILRRRRPQL